MNSQSEPPTHMPEWVQTDQWADVASSLEHLSMSLRLVGERPQEWKWAIIACHSALQGTLICVLSGSDGIGCLTDRSMKAVLDWIEESRSDRSAKHPDERVAELPVLIKRAQDPNYMSEFGGAPLPLDAAAAKDIDLLHILRNRFTHFRPSSWSIETTGLPRITHAAVKIAQRIMFGHPTCMFRLDNEQTELFTSRFRDISQALEALGAPSLPLLIPEHEHLLGERLVCLPLLIGLRRCSARPATRRARNSASTLK